MRTPKTAGEWREKLTKHFPSDLKNLDPELYWAVGAEFIQLLQEFLADYTASRRECEELRESLERLEEFTSCCAPSREAFDAWKKRQEARP